MEPEITHFGDYVQSQAFWGFFVFCSVCALDYANLQMIHLYKLV